MVSGLETLLGVASLLFPFVLFFSLNWEDIIALIHPSEESEVPPVTFSPITFWCGPILLDYYRFRNEMPLECERCGWRGLAGEGSREYYDILFDISCPRCEKMLVVVSHPTFRETREEAAEGNPEALANIPAVRYAEAVRDGANADELEALWKPVQASIDALVTVERPD